MRRFASPLVLALLLAGYLASVAQAREAVKGPGYRTSAPTGWVIDKQSNNGWRTVTITPPGHVNNQRDSALVSISVASPGTVKRAVRHGLADKRKLAEELISIPPDAVSIQQAFPPRLTRWRGKSAGSYGVRYNFKGIGTTHVSTVVRRGPRIYLIQVLTDQDLSELITNATDSITDHWRWK